VLFCALLLLFVLLIFVELVFNCFVLKSAFSMYFFFVDHFSVDHFSVSLVCRYSLAFFQARVLQSSISRSSFVLFVVVVVVVVVVCCCFFLYLLVPALSSSILCERHLAFVCVLLSVFTSTPLCCVVACCFTYWCWSCRAKFSVRG